MRRWKLVAMAALYALLGALAVTIYQRMLPVDWPNDHCWERSVAADELLCLPHFIPVGGGRTIEVGQRLDGVLMWRPFDPRPWLGFAAGIKPQKQRAAPTPRSHPEAGR